ncbi:hypothetical protein ACVINI_000619 [Rhizobium beringeri]|jgi:hypothetical protein
MLIVKSTYFKVFLPMPRSMTNSRAGLDTTEMLIAHHHAPPNLDYPFQETRELRLPHRKTCRAVETGIPNVCNIFERSGANIVNNNQFLGIIFEVEGVTKMRSNEVDPVSHIVSPRYLRIYYCYYSERRFCMGTKSEG